VKVRGQHEKDQKEKDDVYEGCYSQP
jgi:hypothetical protein